MAAVLGGKFSRIARALGHVAAGVGIAHQKRRDKGVARAQGIDEVRGGRGRLLVRRAVVQNIRALAAAGEDHSGHALRRGIGRERPDFLPRAAARRKEGEAQQRRQPRDIDMGEAVARKIHGQRRMSGQRGQRVVEQAVDTGVGHVKARDIRAVMQVELELEGVLYRVAAVVAGKLPVAVRRERDVVAGCLAVADARAGQVHALGRERLLEVQAGRVVGQKAQIAGLLRAGPARQHRGVDRVAARIPQILE